MKGDWNTTRYRGPPVATAVRCADLSGPRTCADLSARRRPLPALSRRGQYKKRNQIIETGEGGNILGRKGKGKIKSKQSLLFSCRQRHEHAARRGAADPRDGAPFLEYLHLDVPCHHRIRRLHQGPMTGCCPKNHGIKRMKLRQRTGHASVDFPVSLGVEGVHLLVVIVIVVVFVFVFELRSMRKANIGSDEWNAFQM